MKKIFVLLTALLLCTGMVVQAQRLDAAEDYSQGYLFNENGQISGRNNAPMATFPYSTFSNTYARTSKEWTNNAGTVEVRDLYWFSDSEQNEWVEIMFIINVSDETDYGNIIGPPPGTYNTWYNGNSLSSNVGCLSYNSSYKSNAKAYVGGWNTWTFTNGTVIVERGQNGYPYVSINCNTAKGGNVTCTCGVPIPKYTITGTSNDTSYGSVTMTADGFSTITNDSYNYPENTPLTLEATRSSDSYVFSSWNDGDRTNPREVTVTEAKTYTAIFTAAIGGTITVNAGDNGQVKLDNSSWGTIFSSDYNGGDNATIAAQANDGYLFYQWSDSVSNTETASPYVITVSGNNTYTAEFRRAYTLTTAVNDPSYGSVSLTTPYRDGKYYEEQSVTLTATPANKLCAFTQWSDGNTDNPRTITVNSSTAAVTYTAQFDEIEAIQIIDDEGLLYHSSDYGFFEGKGNGYAFHFETHNAPISVTQNYTAIDESYTKLFASENWTNQVSINFSTMTVSISRVYVTATMYVYQLEAMFEDTSGQLYYVRIRAIGPMTADQVNTNDNVDWTSSPGTLSSSPTLTKVGDRRYRLEVEGGDFSGYSYGYDAYIDFILDDEDAIDGNILPGVYPITYTGESHTVAMAEYPSFNYTSSSASTSTYYTSFNGSYARKMYIGTGLGNIWWYYLCGGTVTVTKSGSTYNIAVDAICSKANPNLSYPSAYYTVKFNVSGVPAPSVIPTHTATFYDSDGETILGTRTLTAGSTLTAPNVSKTGYEFIEWSPAVPATMPNSDVAYTAVWSQLYTTHLTLEDNRDAAYYNTFATDYNGVEVETVTYSRTFRANTWSTVCLPFDVDEDNLSGAGWLGSVYEFKHATGTANVDDGLYLNFYPAREMEAGKGYLVYSRGADLSGDFEFYDVTIDTSKDTKDDITNLTGYNDGQGTITLVGTLRQGTLTPNATSQMALKDNKVWYPGSGTTTIRAYRGFFKDSSGSSIPPRVHIVVEGEVVTDLEIMENGELRMDNAEVRKYIDNGVLIIERNGVKYDAQGKRIEN